MTWKTRLTQNLERDLQQSDPRPALSAYHNMPYAIFWYPPEVEFALRSEVSLLATRLTQAGKRVTIVSLAECLAEALANEAYDPAEGEAAASLAKTVETVHEILGSTQPLDAIVAARIPPDADPLSDVVFLLRAGALFPVYRTSSLLEQLQGRVLVPAVLFYPGELHGAAELRFMGVLEAEHNYRPRIY